MAVPGLMEYAYDYAYEYDDATFEIQGKLFFIEIISPLS